jgi:hypothetical protein
LRSDSGSDFRQSLVGLNDAIVAEFKNGDIVARRFGRLHIEPLPIYHQIRPGTYTGQIFFKIGIEND